MNELSSVFPLSSGFPYQTLMAPHSPQATDREEACLLMCRRPLCRRLSLPESPLQEEKASPGMRKAKGHISCLWLLSEWRCKPQETSDLCGWNTCFFKVELPGIFVFNLRTKSYLRIFEKWPKVYKLWYDLVSHYHRNRSELLDTC